MNRRRKQREERDAVLALLLLSVLRENAELRRKLSKWGRPTNKARAERSVKQTKERTLL